jgi:hypothetical protein
MRHSLPPDGGDDDKPNGSEAGPASGDYSPPPDLTIPGETEALPPKQQ